MKQKIIIRLCAWMSILYTHPCFFMVTNHQSPIPESISKAIIKSDIKTVQEYFTEHPEHINQTLSDHGTPLTKSVVLKNIILIRWFLTHGANPNTIPLGTSSTPMVLITAKRNIQKKDIKIIRLLLQHGAIIDARVFSQETALMIAAQNSSSIGLIKFLLDHGANPELTNSLKNNSVYLGININRFQHVKRFFQQLASYQENRLKKLIESTTIAIDSCRLISSYLSNEYPHPIKRSHGKKKIV